ncbi:TonB-dependent receptor plug domain-containing protein [Pontibacter populi]|uniref:TonB-dependent receptor plug domain-containing protein n=1 Tax=Pontibacter populi TaxID=890055 RepID=A0ABV1RR96_9BACT
MIKVILPLILSVFFSNIALGQNFSLSVAVDSIIANELKHTYSLNKKYIEESLRNSAKQNTGLNVTNIRHNGNSNSDPLIVLDGVIVNKAQLVNLKLDDVKSIKTINDTTAVQLYGVRAVSGVINIKSKLSKRKVKKKL